MITDHPVLKVYEGNTPVRPAKVVQCDFCNEFAGEVGEDEQKAVHKAEELGFKHLDSEAWSCSPCFRGNTRLSLAPRKKVHAVPG